MAELYFLAAAVLAENVLLLPTTNIYHFDRVISPRLLTQFSKKEIDALFVNAKRIYKNKAFLLLCNSTQKTYGRILIVISRTTGNAVERNVLRRRIKAIFYKQQLYKYPANWVIIVYKAALDLSFTMFTSLLTTHIRPC